MLPKLSLKFKPLFHPFIDNYIVESSTLNQGATLESKSCFLWILTVLYCTNSRRQVQNTSCTSLTVESKRKEELVVRCSVPIGVLQGSYAFSRFLRLRATLKCVVDEVIEFPLY